MNAPQAVAANRLKDLQLKGQSIWLDYIQRSLITSGELKRLVDEDGLGGVTSNPAIFEKAITGSNDYTDALKQLGQEKLDAKAVYERIAIRDIQDAADLLRPVYDQSAANDFARRRSATTGAKRGARSISIELCLRSLAWAP